MSWLRLLLLALAAWICSNLLTLLQNYRKVRKLGLPLVILPLNPNNVVWMVASVPLRPVLRRCLPAALFQRFNMSIWGWEFLEKTEPFEKYGKTFIYVTCGRNELNTAEPELAMEILKRPKDFIQTEVASLIMRVFGENVLTSDGESWAKQRKIIASNINERISQTVFGESVRQTTQMLDSYMQEWKGVTDDAIEGLKIVAINVLGAAGYGASRPWKQEKSELPPGFQTTYIEATRAAVENIVAAAVLPTRLFFLPFLPRSVQHIGQAIREYPMHTKILLDAERKQNSELGDSRNNFLSMLVRDSEGHEGDKDDSGAKPAAKLSEDETMGNLFVFTSAGFDTTANTMAYALTLLAAYPEWQKWLWEELDEILHGKADEVDYVEVYPQLIRCLALMHETLRLFNPLLHITKTSGGYTSLTRSSSKETYQIPPKTTIYVSSSAIHLDTEIWGPDALDFRPSRWVTMNPDTGRPTLVTMPKGTFLPWSAGPRVCPGSKMSQVEFVGTFMTIFRRYSVETALRDGETKEQGKERLLALMQDSQPRLTLRMNRPREVKLKLSERV